MLKTEEELRSIVLMYSNAGAKLTDIEVNNVTVTLRRLLLRVRQMNDPSFSDLKFILAWTTSQIEIMLNVEELDDSVYEDGCINELYADIMEYFNFPVEKDEYSISSDFIYWSE